MCLSCALMNTQNGVFKTFTSLKYCTLPKNKG
uniref:Uncharacterized protein n=1 Tax=Anguilla anguilla TaxID=7936 RepID=A0A0E9SIC2_ANGAN